MAPRSSSCSAAGGTRRACSTSRSGSAVPRPSGRCTSTTASGARRLARREDASNLDRAFARTRVREDLLPALRAVDANAERNVLRTARLLRDEAAVLDEVVATALAGRDHIGRAELAGLPPALA